MNKYNPQILNLENEQERIVLYKLVKPRTGTKSGPPENFN